MRKHSDQYFQKKGSLANIKRKLQLGQSIELVSHSLFPELLPKVRGVRTVVEVRTVGVKFSGGSWLYWAKADRVRETEKGFEVSLGDSTFTRTMKYEWRG